ncbi:hypothetical protein DSC45_34560 [Streptomyces sp. YIM 130001]|uniref:hypothetical protein n=1 Tax=Streptomyces sp. YIM 130001 TaxID=2259644 RepID=UPI000E653039|nr:hypothetical protein [Streptomyces sp. YIM 130001]RII06952.1 hypothetical protein DSC45_34560 [Streptomyces sp. YIM 130001]
MDVVLAAPILDEWTALGKDLITFLTAVVMVVAYLASVAATYFTTRSPLKTGVAAVAGAIVLGIIASQTLLSKQTEEQIDQNNAAPVRVVVVADARSGGGPA